MNVTSKFSVDLTKPNFGGRVNAVQGDGNTRCVEVTLLSGGMPWAVPDGVEAVITYRQPDGHKGLYDKLSDGTPAISVHGNKAAVVLAPQMLTVPGNVQVSLLFNDARFNRLSTFPFELSVAPNPAAGAQKTEDYLRLQWLEDKLTECWEPKRTAIDGAVSIANQAAFSANTAAGAAREQAASAESAAHKANAAASGANDAVSTANQAAAAANQAAAMAQTAADTVAVEINQMKGEIAAVSAVCGTLDNTESGTVIQLTDCVERPLTGLRILGRTVQDGTPAPDAPIPFASAGDGGSITVTIETPQNEDALQTMTVSTETGLAGIQGTVRDEIDFVRGVRIVRFKRKRVSPDLNWQYSSFSDRFFVPDADYKLGDANKYVPNVFCTHFKAGKIGDDNTITYINDTSRGYAYRYSALNDDISAWKAFLADNEVYIIGELKDAIEIPLTDKELTAYAELHTNKSNAIMRNDAGARMEIGYQADTKRYIDKKISELAAAIIAQPEEC